jgi:hypothetical protein
LLKTDRMNRIVACKIGFLLAPQILSAHGLSAALNFCIYYIRTSTKDPVFQLRPTLALSYTTTYQCGQAGSAAHCPVSGIPLLSHFFSPVTTHSKGGQFSLTEFSNNQTSRTVPLRCAAPHPRIRPSGEHSASPPLDRRPRKCIHLST